MNRLNRLAATLTRLAGLPALAGYRTYIGAAAQAATGVGLLVASVWSFRAHDYDLCETCIGFGLGGAYALSKALADLGLGKKLDGLAGVSPGPDPTAEFVPLRPAAALTVTEIEL